MSQQTINPSTRFQDLLFALQDCENGNHLIKNSSQLSAEGYQASTELLKLMARIVSDLGIVPLTDPDHVD